ncbi:MAG: VIT1/CCC1 transporter family protein [bacterium]|nr:VIT1/CCC1 transporter family protein [bacterium]
MDEQTLKAIQTAQKNEITEARIYDRLARSIKDPHNQKILKRISQDEMRHYAFWKRHTGHDVKPRALAVCLYYLIAKVFGLTFGVKLMEKAEGEAQVNYRKIAEAIPEAESIARDEDAHEEQLLAMLDEERLKYIGAIVLGLNDALVELTGALAGFTFALAHPRLIAMAGLVTGIAASLSMAGSEYLATRSKPGELKPVKAALYTGAAYILTVTLLILPYLLLSQVYLSLGLTMLVAMLIISLFNFYYAVAKDMSFWKRFAEMAGISLGIAALSFGVGFAIRELLSVDI